MAVPELMRILLDEAKLGWDRAWDLTVRTLAADNLLSSIDYLGEDTTTVRAGWIS